jgi:SAM-dependent methyltransferase
MTQATIHPREVQNMGDPSALPAWSPLLRQDDARWQWQGQQLVHRDRRAMEIPRRSTSQLQQWVVEHVYAAQKHSQQVQVCLDRLFHELGPTQWGLNLGAGDTDYHDQVINLDIQDASSIDILNLGTELPFSDDSLDLVISQEALEHIEEPFHTIAEVHRVLRPGGKFYCQVPFLIGFHPGPSDFWRFSRQALEHLFENEQWEIEELELALGHGSGFYRILVEFLAVNASIVSQRLYKPVKGLSAILCWPLQWLDVLTPLSAEKDRIPGGYFCVARKR